MIQTLGVCVNGDGPMGGGRGNGRMGFRVECTGGGSQGWWGGAESGSVYGWYFVRLGPYFVLVVLCGSMTVVVAIVPTVTGVSGANRCSLPLPQFHLFRLPHSLRPASPFWFDHTAIMFL